MIFTQVEAPRRVLQRERQRTNRLADKVDQGKSYEDAPPAAPRVKRSSGPASKPPAAKKAKKAPAKAPKKNKRGRPRSRGPGPSLAEMMERAKARRTEPPKPPAS